MYLLLENVFSLSIFENEFPDYFIEDNKSTYRKA